MGVCGPRASQENLQVQHAFFGSPAQDRSDAQPEKCPLARARAWPPMATSAGPSDALLEPTPASQLPRDRGGRPTPLTAGAHSPTHRVNPRRHRHQLGRLGLGAALTPQAAARRGFSLRSLPATATSVTARPPRLLVMVMLTMAELASGVQLLQAGAARCRSSKRFRKVSPRAARPSGLQPRSAWRTTSSSAS